MNDLENIAYVIRFALGESDEGTDVQIEAVRVDGDTKAGATLSTEVATWLLGEMEARLRGEKEGWSLS